MCVLYSVIKGLLIGMAGKYQGAFAAEHVVKLVQSFAKAVEHCPKFPGAAHLGLADANGMGWLAKSKERGLERMLAYECLVAL